MIVQLSPKYKFVCDRCGKEIFPDSEDGIRGIHHVAFLKDTDFLFGDKKKSGDICDECHKEFVEIADNFFDETNKEEAEAALAERSGEYMETRDFECDNGRIYQFPAQHCAFCEHCTHVLYDYSHGPYMFMCDIGAEDYRTCGKFCEEESEEESNESQNT